MWLTSVAFVVWQRSVPHAGGLVALDQKSRSLLPVIVLSFVDHIKRNCMRTSLLPQLLDFKCLLLQLLRHFRLYLK